MPRLREWWHILVARCRALILPQRVHDEIDEELQFHIEMRVREHVRNGMPEPDARRAATLAFGSVPAIKELSYDIRGGGWLEALGRDLSYAIRSIRKQRALSTVVIGIVAIGIGANAAILGVADRVLWRELPVRAPGELDQITPASELTGISYPFYRALRQDSGGFAGVVARSRQTSTFGVGESAERRVVELVSGNYFSVLGVAPAEGRVISDADDAALMSHPVAVISDRYWRTRFGASPGAIGKTIVIDDYPLTIIGVAPRKFFGVEVGIEPDAWAPLAMHPVLFAAHRSLVDDSWMWLDVIARRAPGQSHEAATARASVILSRFDAAADERIRNSTPNAVRLDPANRGLSSLRGSMRLPLVVLIGIVAFVLVVACANLATLIVVRSAARSREIGVRLAMGASRARVVRQLLLESLLLAASGGVLGTVLAIVATRALAQLLLAGTATTEIDVTPDARLLVVSLILSTLIGVVFGIAPAVRAARIDIASVIRDAIPSTRGRRWRFGTRRALVAGQAAVSLVLVIAAGLFTKTLLQLNTAPAGFDADRVLMATINPTLNRYTPASAAAFYHALEARLAAAPGVRAAGTSVLPLLGGQNSYNVTTMRVPGQKKRTDPLSLLTQSVGGDFFGATGVRIIRGRALDVHDAGDGPVSLVLNETAARVYFGSEDPVGRTVRLMGQPATVVGLARDSKYRTMRETMPQIVYLTFDQDAFVGGLERTVYVRGTGDPRALAGTLESAVHGLDRELSVYDVRTLGEQRRRSMASERVVAWLSGLAAGIALLLAAIGLYGLVAFDTQHRTREIGVRISLGATQSRIMALVLRGAFGLIAVGAIAGLALSRGLSKLVSAQLYGVSAGDVTIAVAACVALMTTAFVAASIPAWRAARVNPVEALRCE